MDQIKSNRVVYWLLIGTFIALYLCIAFVSTLHAITFFQIANPLGLAILLGAAYEIGQSAILFSLMMTRASGRVLSWAMMFLLTSLQITANVYSSFKFMDLSGTTDWEFFQRSILFWLDAADPEMFKVIIAWITGALLPIVALGLTSLVADSIKLFRGDVGLDEYEYVTEEETEDETEDEENKKYEEPNEALKDAKKEYDKKIIEDALQRTLIENKGGPIWPEEEPTALANSQYVEEADKSELAKENEGEVATELLDVLEELQEENLEDIRTKEPIIDDVIHEDGGESYVNPDKITKDGDPKPINPPRGWHLKKEFIDENGNIFNRGKYVRSIKNDEENWGKGTIWDIDEPGPLPKKD